MLVREIPVELSVVAIVGHNPGLAELAVGLAAPPPQPPASFPTAAIAVLGLPGAWSDAGPGEAKLLAFATPADMRALSGLPSGADLGSDFLVFAGGDDERAGGRAVRGDLAGVARS